MLVHASDLTDEGSTMYGWAQDLFPICRSITGEGVRESLGYFQRIVPELEIKSIASGTPVFDWTVPKEWRISSAYIKDPHGKIIVDFADSNLHVVGYSIPVHKTLSLQELDGHLYSLPNMPDAIPYVTSYYAERWGFCLTHEQRQSLEEGDYEVFIDSELFDGVLNYGEVLIPGETEKEILLSTYICHPSLANNELSGPIVTTGLINKIKAIPNRKYTYRVLFLPETIGSISYLSQHLQHLQQQVEAGFVLTCIGDDRNYSYLSSRQENTLADRAAIHTLEHMVDDFKRYDFLQRGSDERQYCAPGVDLPVCSLMRTRYGDYPEYHTSLDNLDLISNQGLAGGLAMAFNAVNLLEQNATYEVTVKCEPQLGKRGLYPTVSDMSQDYSDVQKLTNFIAYCDGTRDLMAIADKISVSAFELMKTAALLEKEGLLRKV
ncbi:MAG: aminopeptidase [Colwelliaceae bacterium]|nr:aminopeptidase [Colwelliaceae bacterium]